MYSFNDGNETESIENAKAKIVYNVVMSPQYPQWSPSTIMLCIVVILKIKEQIYFEVLNADKT